MSTRVTFSRYKQMRWYSTQKMKVIDSVNELLTTKELKPKRHPGKQKPKYVEQPSWLLKAIHEILCDRKVSRRAICADSQVFVAHLCNRCPPSENEDIQSKLQEFKENYQKDEAEDASSNNVAEITDKSIDAKLETFLKSSLYNWEPIDYNKYTSLVYLVGRSVPEYSILYKIFQEIVDNDTNFAPKALFDFGSGIGTVMWAASQFWVRSIKEYYCVDISRDMNEMSEYLIKRATPHINCNHIFYRQFFPASPTPTYDIVVSAYSLLELPSQKARIEAIFKLWRKTENYMIVVEHGSTTGFKLINEARDAILSLGKNAHVISPCPHDLKCPIYMTNKPACNFEFSYLTLPIGETADYKRELYSYVILKKGTRPEDICKWPRIVRPVLRRSRHVICRMCTNSGELQEEIFTAWKSGKNTYRCAWCSEWGDRLPVHQEESKKTEELE